MIFCSIDWNPNPEIFKIFEFPVRYYGLFFAMAFFGGVPSDDVYIQKRGEASGTSGPIAFICDGCDGGRRANGHYFFYEFPLLQADPMRFFIQMITPPFSGLASHGAAVGLFFGLLFVCEKKSRPVVFVCDRPDGDCRFLGRILYSHGELDEF